MRGAAPHDADAAACSTVGASHNVVMEQERHEAIGQRGEACIILSRMVRLPSGDTTPVYSLASGERLRPTDVAGEFVTVNGNRSFRLREPGA